MLLGRYGGVERCYGQLVVGKENSLDNSIYFQFFVESLGGHSV